VSTSSGSPGFSGRTAWARSLAAPVRDFLSTETGSAVALVTATVTALIWANSPGWHAYVSLWSTHLTLSLGHARLTADLRHWVNQGLMTLFFLVVGLEARRELDMGELRQRRRLAIPVLAAAGGMLVPILIFLAINAGGPGTRGWGAAMSTDTAFALGALALLVPRVATRLRVFLLTVAVFDDLGALVVIAVAYTTDLNPVALLVGVALFGGLLALRHAPPLRRLAGDNPGRRRPAELLLGGAVWVALFRSGIDPVVAGLAIGLATSAYPPSRESLEQVTALTRSFREQPTPELARSAQLGVVAAISPNEGLQYALHSWTSYVIVPLFALANAGIHFTPGLLSHALTSPITLGIAIAYVAGKPLGIVGASFLASRPRFHGPRPPVSWPILSGGAAIAGVGFTVSLLISSLAFSGRNLAEAKLGVLLSAIIAPLVAAAVFAVTRRLPAATRARQLAGTSEEILDLSDDVDPERDHIRGPEGALVTIVEYGDFECPFCGQAEPVIRELLSTFGDELRYVWRHLPLSDVHTTAQLAAEASEAAAAQGAFWPMYERLLAHPDLFTPADIDRFAGDLQLDADRFESDLRRRVMAGRIAEDVASADASGVSGTPTFFINRRRHQGAYDIETLSSAVSAARRRAALLSATGAS
jgi:Na+/H+ antiporter NhaA